MLQEVKVALEREHKCKLVLDSPNQPLCVDHYREYLKVHPPRLPAVEARLELYRKMVKRDGTDALSFWDAIEWAQLVHLGFKSDWALVINALEAASSKPTLEFLK